MGRKSRLFLVLAWMAAAAGIGSLGVTTAVASPRYHVSVVRDSAGIPHIRAPDFRSLGYGEGYSYAQDNTCLFADAIVTVRGQRSHFFGAGGTSYYYSNDSVDPNPKSDAFWKWVRASGAAKGVGRAFNKRTAALYHGWAQGYNAYLRSGKLKDPGLQGQALGAADLVRRPAPARAADRDRRVQRALHRRPLRRAAAGEREPGPRDRPAQADIDPEALREAVGDEAGDSELGSNGVGFGSRGTGGKGGLLLANPHFPWRGVDRFWMAHLTVPGQYDAMGGTLGGFPWIGVGFNSSLAWTHTVSTGRRFVIVQLKLAPGDPTSYLVGGQKVPMTRTTVKVAGDRHTFYGTRYGLVVTIPQAGYFWTNDTAYALLDTNLNNRKIANQYLAMGRAKNVHELLRIEERAAGSRSSTRSPRTRRGRRSTPTSAATRTCRSR